MTRRAHAALLIASALAALAAPPAVAAPMDASWVAKWRQDLAFMADGVPPPPSQLLPRRLAERIARPSIL
jgi:hypothetical protein